MNLSTKKGTIMSDKIGTTSSVKPLNPNAAAFVPFALRSSTESSNKADILSSQTLGKSVIDRSESLISNISDDEIHQYWRQQLPDDITPDFEIMGQDEHHGINNLPFANLCLQENQDLALKEQVELPLSGTVGNNFASKMRYSVPYGEDVSSTNFIHLPNKPWDDSVLKNDQLLTSSIEGSLYNGSSVADALDEHSMVEHPNLNPFELMAMRFPGFSAESLGDVYIANGCDLDLTIDMLTQLELQVDSSSFNPNQNSKALSTPNFNGLDFPALPVSDNQNGAGRYFGEDLHQPFSPYKSTSKDNLLSFTTSSTIQPRGAVDFASAVRKMASRESNIRKYDRNGSPVASTTVGSSRSSNLLGSSFSNVQTRGISGDGFQSRTSSRAAPSWLETGEAVANMYSEMREEARDHARVRNAYFEQARQAYLIGNKALAKELSVKGQLHNMHMKAAHGKAQESIYRQRNPEIQGNGGRVEERIIDLHGLHVNEAIPVLKRELAQLRAAARSEDQRVQVYICVGTGHHTRGSRTPARLPIAVQRYLLEEESLDYSEPQPGLLRVVVR
ncbi:polyadenylate-binding protein-interacting protein 7-like [Impatiens glandulifera]|uniref:polyadenylate-binding protein-interacting protein 7-like n=1 Tax=Impatiens glandulifera TaxID=253017 RepID=UPI001FB0E54A|nr:polyadenylate-binding protein-interacting protein 7-like [Impatiens glandulifera]XP_047325333.1 polyadenylate-binding protein-interacting protein 7-like [Impatiens glandulifera]XP_047325334.1 polyadenylate-binding protein-interacting protein 7-like [Impatiens glandulifera]